MAQQTIQFGLKINADTSDARAELDRLKQILGQLGTGTGFKFNAKQEIREASVAAQQLQKHLAAATSKTGDFDINRFTASIKKGEMSLSEMSMKLMQLGTEGTNAFRTLSTQILNAQKPALSFSNILTKMGTTLANNIRWQLSSAAINAFTGGVREAWDYTKNMDKALTNIRVVTGKSREEMDKLAAASNRMAKELRSTTEEMVKGQLIFYQQGDSAALAAEKARITAMAANVSFESSQEEMADYLTAIWNSYQVGENELELFVDKLSAVGASTATSMEEIATGMTKVASAANAVGVTYDQLNATIATISSTTRVSAESVGTAMKTIYARMGDLKVGKADEDGITYGQVSKQMKQMGIDIADANGQLRDMGEVVEEIGNKWKTFSKEEQQALVQAVAGKRQYTNLTALFENWDMYLNTLETSKNAMGTLQEQQDAWANSIEGASNRVASSLEGLYSRILNDDVVINMTNSLASFLEYFTGLIDALGGLETILPLVGSMLVSAFAPQIINGFSTGLMNIRTLFGGWKTDLEKAREQIAFIKGMDGFKNLSSSAQSAVLQTEKLVQAQNKYIANAKHMSSSEKAIFQGAIDTAKQYYDNASELMKLADAQMRTATKQSTDKPYGEQIGAFNNFNSGTVNDSVASEIKSAIKQNDMVKKAFSTLSKKDQILIQSEDIKNVEAYTEAVNRLQEAVIKANAVPLSPVELAELDKQTSKIAEAQLGIENLVNAGIASVGEKGVLILTDDITELDTFKQKMTEFPGLIEAIQTSGIDGILDENGMIDDNLDIDTLKNKLQEVLKKLRDIDTETKDGIISGVDSDVVSGIVETKKSASRERQSGNKVVDDELAKSFVKPGQAALSAASGIATFTTSLQSLKSAGEAIQNGDWLTGISSGIMSITMATSGISAVTKAFGDMRIAADKAGMSAASMWLKVLGPYALIAAGIAAVSAAIWFMVKDFNEAETNAKSAAEQAKYFSDELDSANQELTDLKNNFKNYNTKQSALDKMTEGTEEFRKALQEANEEVIDLMTKYPELAEYVNDVNGRLKITAEGQRKLLEAQQAEVDRAYTNKLSSNIVAIESRQEANEQKLASKVLGDRASATGEAVGGGLSGAAIGAAIGSAIAPGIGTAVGALLGVAAGSLAGYFASNAKDFKEHGLDKFTHAVETQGTNILSSYESLERALGGDSELAQALWENKEETNKLAREIIANKKQIDLNTKQLIIANNPEVAGSEYSSDITNIGKDIVQNEGRINKYEEEIKAMFADGDQDAMDAYLKAMYGDEADKYRIVDTGGTGNTLQKQNDDGTWTTQGEKNSLTNDVIIANYAAKMASNLTDAEIEAIEKVSQGLKERIQNYTEGNGDEIVKKIIDEYGGTPEKALKYIEEQGAGYYAIFTKHLSEDIDKAFSGSHNRVKAEEEALKFALGNNPAFEGLEEAFKNNDDGALKSYLADFQEMGLLTEHNLETFKLFKNEIMDGNLASRINVLTNKYWNQDFVDLTGTNLKTGTKQQLNKYDQIENVKISDSELQSQTEALLANSGLTEYQISQVVLDVLKAGKFTEEIENEVNHIIANAKSFAESSISDISIQHLEFDTTKEYFSTLANGEAEQQAYIDAVNAMNEADFSRIEIEDDKIQFLREDGTVIDEVTSGTMAFNAVLRDGVAPLEAFSDTLGGDAYDSLVDYNEELGRSPEEFNNFLNALDEFDASEINEFTKNLEDGKFNNFELNGDTLTFFDESGKKVQELTGDVEDLAKIAKFFDSEFELKIGYDISIEELKKDKKKVEEEISSWGDLSGKGLTREQRDSLLEYLPSLSEDELREYSDRLYRGELTIDNFIKEINNKKFDSIVIGLDFNVVEANPQILYDYAEALGIPKERADELKVAFQQLADNGIAYATKDKDGAVHYFDSLGNEITGLGADAVGTEAQMLALERNAILPLSSFPGLNAQVYNSIIDAGTAAGWSNGQINTFASALSSLSSLNVDLSQPAGELYKLKGEAAAAIATLLAAGNLELISSYQYDEEAMARGDFFEAYKNQKITTVVRDKSTGKTYATVGEAVSAKMGKIDLSTLGNQYTGSGYVPSTTNDNNNNNNTDDRITDGDDSGSGGDNKSPQQKAFEAEKRKYDEALAQAEADLENGVIDEKEYRKRVEVAWANLISAYQALSSEEKEEAKDTMRQESLNIRQVVIDYFDNIYNSWVEAYEYAEHLYGSGSKMTELETKSANALKTLMSTGGSKDLYDVYHEWLEASQNESLSQAERDYAKTRAGEVWDVIAGLEKDYTDYDYLDYVTNQERNILQADKNTTYEDWQEHFQKKLDILKAKLESGKITYKKYREEALAAINAGYWDYAKGEMLPVFSADQRKEMIDTLNSEDAETASEYFKNEYSHGRMGGIETAKNLLETAGVEGIDEDTKFEIVDESIEIAFKDANNSIDEGTEKFKDNLEKLREIINNPLLTKEQKEAALKQLDEYVDSVINSTMSKIDNLQSIYSNLKKVVEEYNDHQAISVDNFQMLMQLEPKYLGLLFDEYNQLNLNEEAIYRVTEAQIEQAASEAAIAFANSLINAEDEAAQWDILTVALDETSDSYLTLAKSMLEAAHAEGKMSDEVYAKALERLENIKTVTEKTKEGLRRGGMDGSFDKEENNEQNELSKEKEKERRLLEKRYKNGELTSEEYYQGLSAITKKYMGKIENEGEKEWSEESKNDATDWANTELEDLKDRFLSGEIDATSYRKAVGDFINMGVYDYELGKTVSLFSPEERESFWEGIAADIEESVSNGLDFVNKKVLNYKDASTEMLNAYAQAWGLNEISESNWDSLGDNLQETVERQGKVIESATSLLESTSTLWEDGLITFKEGMERNLYYTKEWGFALTEEQKRIYTNIEKQLEKFISAQKSLYEKGALTLSETIRNIVVNKDYDERQVRDAVREIIDPELELIIEDFEEGRIDTVSEAAEKIITTLINSGIDDMEEINKILAENLATLYDHNMKSIKDKYDAIELSQDMADWGMTGKDLNGDGTGTENEFRLDLWQKEYAEHLALMDSYEANYRGTQELIYNETWQGMLSRQKELQEEGKKLADSLLSERAEYLDRQKRLGKVTIDDEINYLNQTAWMLKNDAFREFFENEEDYIKWLQDKSLEAWEKRLSALQKKAELIKNQLIEGYEDQKTLIQKQKEVEETRFSNIMTLRQAQHELNKELQTSLTMYEYLDEETRKLIFNEEDYMILSDKILEIQNEINALTEDYNQQLVGKTKEEMALLTEEYKAQIELKMKELEVAKANLEVTKKQLALQNTLNERNTRMFINGQWTWVANPESVAKARQEILDATYNVETAQLNLQHQENMKVLDDDTRALDRQINDINERFDALKEKIGNEQGGVIASLEEFDKALLAWETEHGLGGGEVTEGFKDGHWTRDMQKDLTDEALRKVITEKLPYFFDFNSKGHMWKNGQHLDLGEKKLVAFYDKEQGEMKFRESGTQKVYSSNELQRLITNTLPNLTRKEVDTLFEQMYNYIYPKTKTTTAESQYVTREKYGKGYQTDMIGYIEEIITLLENYLITEERLARFSERLDKAEKDKGALVKIGDKVYISQGDGTFFDSSEGKTFTKDEVLEIYKQIGEIQKANNTTDEISTSEESGKSHYLSYQPGAATTRTKEEIKDLTSGKGYKNALKEKIGDKINLHPYGQIIDNAYGGTDYSEAFWEAVYDKVGEIGENLTEIEFLAILGAFYKDGPEKFLELLSQGSNSFLLGKGSPISIGKDIKNSPQGVETVFSIINAQQGPRASGIISEESYMEIVDKIAGNKPLKVSTSLDGAVGEDGTIITQDNGIASLTDKDGTLKTSDSASFIANQNYFKTTTSSIEDIIEAIGDISFDQNARGDIINRPTLSWVGEDGPEAIIPLSQKYRDRGLSLWEEATKALGITPSFTMPTIRALFPQQKENMNVSQTINVTVQNEDSSNDFYAITNLL